MNIVLNAQLFLQPGITSPVIFPTADKKSNIFSVTINPALASFKEKYSFGMYGEKPLLIKGFNAISLAMLVPVNHLGIFGGMNHAGVENYNQSSFRLGVGRELGLTRIGIGGSYRSINIKGYGRINKISLEVGALAELIPEVMAIFHINGISSISKNHIDEMNDLTIAGGLIYTVSGEVTIGMNWTKTRGSPGHVHVNTKYIPATNISLDIGYLSNINGIYIGASYRQGKFSMAIYARYQQVFGITPTTMIMYDQ